MLRVSQLDHVALEVVSPQEVCEFYEAQWGMTSQVGDKGDIYLSCPSQTHPELVLKKGPVNRLAHLSFSARRAEDIDGLARTAIKSGYLIGRHNDEGLGVAGGQGITIRDPDNNTLEIVWRGQVPVQPVASQSPVRLGHVVLWTPNPEGMEAFYAGLGFQVSDRTVRGMSFLRCNTDHHTLAFVKGARTGLQHMAFDGLDLNHVMRAYGKLQAAGVPCIWGPGRHGPGENIFTYYKDPAGNVIELYSDLEKVADSEARIETKFWGPEHKGDVWGSAGPVPQEFIG